MNNRGNITVVIAADIHDDALHLDSGFRQEWESLKSINYISECLLVSGYKTVVISGIKALLEFTGKISNHEKHQYVIMNLIEGFHSRNREAYVPALAEMAGFPHTGSDASAQIVTLDKYLTGLVADKTGVPVKDKKLIQGRNDFRAIEHYPVFIKPRYEGSGSGIGEWSLVAGEEQVSQCYFLLDVFGELVAEEVLPGDEYTIAVTGNRGNYKLSETARIEFPGDVYGESIKRKDAMPETLHFDVPVQIDRLVREATAAVCSAINVSGYARADWKTDGAGNPFLLELNLTPGLSYFYSSFPVCYARSGGTYQEMLEEIVLLALLEYEQKRFMYGKM